MCVVASSVRHGNPVHQTTHRSVFPWRENHVPVIGHPLVRNQINRVSPKAFVEYPLKRFGVGLLVEDRQPTISSIQSMVNLPSNIGTRRSWHCLVSEKFAFVNYQLKPTQPPEDISLPPMHHPAF